MANNAKQVTGLWGQFIQDWFSWDAWILAAYRDRIEYRSFLEAQDSDLLKKRVTEDQKDWVIETHRAAILEALRLNTYENIKKKTLLHFLGKICVYMLALSSGFVLSIMVMGHLAPYLPPMGRIVSDIISWGFFGIFYLAHLLAFRKSVPSTSEKLLYVDNVHGWHFFAREELTVCNKNGKVLTQFYDKNKREFVTEIGNNTFSTGEKVAGITLLMFVIVVASITAALSVVKIPISLQSMNLLAYLQLGATFTPIGYVLGAATFICTLALMISSVIRLLRHPDKLNDLKKLFHFRGDSHILMKQALMGVLFVVVLGLVGYGMYKSSMVEAEDFMSMIQFSGNAAGALTLAICAMAGKLVFSARAAVNLLNLGSRFVTVKVGQLVSWVTGWFSKSVSSKEVELIVDPVRSKEDFAPHEKVGAALGVAFQPAKTAQPPEQDRDDDCDEDNDFEGSPLFSGSAQQLFYAWVGGAGAVARQFGALMDNYSAYDPDKNKSKLKT